MGTAKLALEDGSVFTGQSFGADGEITGEVVFNTSMTGYQEILTDPSYRGQIVTMTYPEMGNYGVNSIDLENESPSLSGFIVREISRVHSNYRSEGDLASYLKQHQLIGLAGIDTRALVRRIREKGAMRGILSTTDLDDASLVAKAAASPGLVGRDLVQEVMCKETLTWNSRLDDWTETEIGVSSDTSTGKHIVCMDFGMKWNIPRHFVSRGNRVTIVPGTTSADDILRLEPDGVFLSNGPGDPEPLTYAHGTIAELIGKRPIFGICLGHQLLSLACGAKTFKLKFGHRGANQPVFDYETGKVEITSQNHGFVVSREALETATEVEETHVHLNDNTVAGIRVKGKPVFSVQYHPEASAGPHDSRYLFDEFVANIAKEKSAVLQ